MINYACAAASAMSARLEKCFNSFMELVTCFFSRFAIILMAKRELVAKQIECFDNFFTSESRAKI